MLANKASLIATLISLLMAGFLAAAPQGLVKVEVYIDGSAHVIYTFPTNGSAVIDLGLIGQPDPGMVILVENEKGETLPYSINQTQGDMTIITLDSAQVTVDYYTSTVTSKVAGRWIVNFTSPLPVQLKLPPNATLSAIYTVPDSISTQGGSIILSFKPGPVLIGYILPPSQATSKPSSQPTPTAPSQQPSSPKPPEAPASPSTQPSVTPSVQWAGFNPLYIASIIIVIMVVILYFILRRREREELSEVDTQIIEVIRRAGGGMFQSELTSTLGLPATTVWRHIRKLESRGIVVLEKRMGRNYIRLIRGA